MDCCDESRKPMVNLDGKCLNCPGTSLREKTGIINCFKIACLNYKSSDVPLPTGEAPRSEVTLIQA